MANTLEDLKNAVATVWINDKKTDFESAIKSCELGEKDVADAEARLKRFAPVIMHYFPETEKTNGIIESPIKEIPSMKENMAENMSGRLFVKLDSHLAVAGSIKARGGIYEVLKHTEDLALENGIIDSTDDDYMKITTDEARKFFASRKIQVGSTGNLGMSIGIMSAALGYTAIVHMSVDAKQWKKDLLRSRGVTVIEYDGDYGKAVEEGRAISDKDETSYFVDDENSRNLFLGYAVAANRIGKQFEENNVVVDDNHPLFVYLPCGVGGGPGGVAFGLKLHYGDNVHCFFVEPTQAPCMVLGMVTGKHNEICVQDIGLTGKTDADGLAVGRPSGFIGKFIEPFLSGEFTVEDGKLYDYLRLLVKSEDVFIEPSSCSAFQGVKMFAESEEMKKYIEDNNLSDKLENVTQIAWATGGSLVPDEQRKYFLEKHI